MTKRDSFPLIISLVSCFFIINSCLPQSVGNKYQVPLSPRAKYSMNPGWKFIKQDVAGAEASIFDDSGWETVSTPHTYNDIDTYDELITSTGEKSEYMGVAWYRKHFKIPAEHTGSKVFIEFEGMRQVGKFYVNGQAAGKTENGVNACGIDITNLVNFGNNENVLAVKIDNKDSTIEESTGTMFQWSSRRFYPNHGGINKNVWLRITGKVYQTLPLYQNLGTKGVYIYPKNISVNAKTADICVESQVKNESGDQQNITLSAILVDTSGIVRGLFTGDTYDMVNNETAILKASGTVSNLNFWGPKTPSLYDVYTLLSVDGNVIDINKIRTGFRKAEFKGGAGTGGLWLNDDFLYLKGYAQRSTNEWAGLGAAYPDWLHYYTAQCIRESNANYIRWMHISPQHIDVTAFDKYGIVQICPAGDMESDVTGRQWEQRKEAMLTTIIYYRNNPSILFYEAGNASITPQHMKEMHDIKKDLDPFGMRAMGCRSIYDPGTNQYTEYVGVMIGQDPRTDALTGYTDMFRGYSHQRRDMFPIIECEDYREEAARRFWDSHSAPHYGFHKGPNDTYDLNSETYCLGDITRYNAYYSQRISNTDANKSKWSGYASIIFTDTHSHGRQYDSEVCRVSGKMDAVRLPKSSYFTQRVIQNENPDIHIIGHWNYADSVYKTIYVVSNCQQVELFINGTSKGKVTTPVNGYLFPFNNIHFEPGTIKAKGYNNSIAVCNHEIANSGEPSKLKLTVKTAPTGLLADGSDVALIDVELVDSMGNRCPTDESRVDFEISGPGIWKGGYNSGIIGSINKMYLNTECGINRVAIRSTLVPGIITVTAKHSGMENVSVQIQSNQVEIKNGLIKIEPDNEATLKKKITKSRLSVFYRNNKISIQSGNVIDRICAYNIKGIQVFYNQNTNASKTKINTNDWNAGIYIISAVSGGEVINKKVLLVK